MGIESLLQQNLQSAGLAGSDRLARNAMFPQGQMDKTQYATPSQMPTSAETIRADYDAPTNAYTGLPTQPFAMGGVARYNGDEDGSVVTTQEDPTFGNPDFQNLSYGQMQDTDRLKALNALKETDPKAYNAQLMGMLSNSIKEQYNTNSNYDKSWQQFEKLREADPLQWYRDQLAFLGHQTGWQIGQNTSERNAALQPQIQDTVAQAKNAGMSDEEIGQILGRSSQAANYQNQRRIINEQQNAGSGIGEGIKTIAPLALMAVAPELAVFMPELGAVGTGALMGGTMGGVTAGLSGGDVGKGILMGGATGAAGGALSGLDPSVATALKGVNTARNIYNVADSGGKNIGADINAFKGIASMAPTTAAHGGLMYDKGGEINNPMSEATPDNVGSLYDAYRALVPAQVRTFAETLGGDRSPITEKNFTEKELRQIKDAVGASRDRQTGRSWEIEHDKKGNITRKQYYDSTVGYDDYGQSKGRLDDLSISPNSAIRNTLGRFAYHKDPEGNLIVTDSYDFYNDLPKRTRPTSDYESMGTLQKLGTLAADTLIQKNGIATLPSRIGNAFIGRDGRPVVLNLGSANFAAGGGIADLGSYSDGGRLLRGPGDGMSDNIPASISGKQPARLADGEFVIPADVVSHLGNGSTDAGAKQLYKMMDRIRHARTGNKKQGKRINPNKFLPKG